MGAALQSIALNANCLGSYGVAPGDSVTVEFVTGCIQAYGLYSSDEKKGVKRAAGSHDTHSVYVQAISMVSGGSYTGLPSGYCICFFSVWRKMLLLLSITAVSAILLLTLPVINGSRRAYGQKLAGDVVVHREREREREKQEMERERLRFDVRGSPSEYDWY